MDGHFLCVGRGSNNRSLARTGGTRRRSLGWRAVSGGGRASREAPHLQGHDAWVPQGEPRPCGWGRGPAGPRGPGSRRPALGLGLGCRVSWAVLSGREARARVSGHPGRVTRSSAITAAAAAAAAALETSGDGTGGVTVVPRAPRCAKS